MMKVALISMLLAYCKMKYYIIQTSNNDNSHKGIAQTGKGVGEYNSKGHHQLIHIKGTS